MILKLSSTNDEHFPIGPTTTYLQVLKQGKAMGVAMVLNVMLSTMGCQVEITTSMANAIKTGNFRANSLLVAHSFSIFNVPYLDAAQMTNFNQTELDLLQSEGEGIPKEIVKKLSENKFKTPTSTHLLRHQFNNWYGLFQIIFGQKALTTLEIREWIDHIDKNPELAEQYDVEGVPDVRIVSKGEVLPCFVGALPEEQIRDLFSRLDLQSELETGLAEIQEAIALDNLPAAKQLFDRFFPKYPNEPRLVIMAVKFLMRLEKWSDAYRLISAIKEEITFHEHISFRHSLYCQEGILDNTHDKHFTQEGFIILFQKIELL